LQNNQEICHFPQLNSSSGYKNNKVFLHSSVPAWALVSVFPKQKFNVAFLSNTFVSLFSFKYIHIHMNRFGKQRRTTEEMYCRTNMAANLSEHDIFAKANAPICELTNKSAATLGDRKSIIVIKKQGLFLFFK